jgi:hypothetical protein
VSAAAESDAISPKMPTNAADMIEILMIPSPFYYGGNRAPRL